MRKRLPLDPGPGSTGRCLLSSGPDFRRGATCATFGILKGAVFFCPLPSSQRGIWTRTSFFPISAIKSFSLALPPLATSALGLPFPGGGDGEIVEDPEEEVEEEEDDEEDVSNGFFFLTFEEVLSFFPGSSCFLVLGRAPFSAGEGDLALAGLVPFFGWVSFSRDWERFLGGVRFFLEVEALLGEGVSLLGDLFRGDGVRLLREGVLVLLLGEGVRLLGEGVLRRDFLPVSLWRRDDPSTGESLSLLRGDDESLRLRYLGEGERPSPLHPRP